jgi:hypothetical protein
MRALLLAGLLALLAAGPAAAADPFAGAHGGSYTTPSGVTVKVFTSAQYPVDDAVNQHWADFLDSLVHGPELAQLTLLLAPPGQVQQACGFGALACYRRQDATIYAPADGPPEGPPPEELIAHEYGHHVAAARENPPWKAEAWGTKRWATAMGICAGVRAGRLHPGNESSLYKTNPGEAFAESYRLLNATQLGLPPSPWNQVAAALLPGPAALAALREDVVDPYAGPTQVTLAGTLARDRPATRTFRIRTALDGLLSAKLTAPPAAKLRLRLDGRAAGVETVCGQRVVVASVQRVSGFGRFTLTVSVP